MTVTKDTIIGDVLAADHGTAPFFQEVGMHCLGCPNARSETVSEACAVHAVDCDALLAKLNAHFSAQ
ncbi:MAG: DUF1858 domain-containing protein [Oscillospiraceae bacterium]|nr:DUF1858 domain-containing protein [Oscillospiraceae bacterium]